MPGAGVARSQNTVFVMANDWASTAQFLAQSLQRVDEAQRVVQLLIVTPDAELAAATAATAVKLTEGRDIGIVAATSARRAARLLKMEPAQVVAGSAETLVDLLKSAALKLDTVRMVCLAWADELIALGALPSLEALMTEVPKESARTVVTSELSPEVEALLERYARRARRVVSPVSETDQPIDLEYISVSPQTRLSTLRRVLDERPNHDAPRSRFSEELEDHMSPEAAETTLRTVINWGRFAEIFAYDDEEQRFTLENPS